MSRRTETDTRDRSRQDFPLLAQRRPSVSPPVPVEERESSARVLSLDDLADELRTLDRSTRVVHCHGVFDVLHIGHIKHLECARKLGDVLVVTITPDRFVNKGPDRPVFGEQLRAEAIAALDCVDAVAINRWPTAEETIQLLRPSVYAKGADYRCAEDDLTGGIIVEKAVVESVGGEIACTDEVTFSSSHLANRHLSLMPTETVDYLHDFGRRYSADDLGEVLERAAGLRVLVVGEAIIDEYQYCDAIGKSSKEPMLAVRPYSVERFAGGVLAVANHLASFTDQVDLVTVLGTATQAEPGGSHEAFVRSQLRPEVEPCFVERPDGPTIVKRRFIDRYFFHKLLAVYEMNEAPLPPDTEQQLIDALEHRLDDVDLVIAVDFGHGVFGERTIEAIRGRAKFLAVNVQANAGNHGFHTASRWPSADYFTLTENEARLEARNAHCGVDDLVSAVAAKLNCDRMVVTRGANGCVTWSADHATGGSSDQESIAPSTVPALANRIRDRMGAGDTFLALSALCLAADAPLEVAAFIGSAASAHAVATVGHRQPVERLPLLRHLQCLLK